MASLRRTMGRLAAAWAVSSFATAVAVVPGAAPVGAGTGLASRPAPVEPAPNPPPTTQTVWLAPYLALAGVRSSSTCPSSTSPEPPDQTAALQTALDMAFQASPVGTVFAFPADQCYVVEGTIVLQDTMPGATPTGTPIFLNDDVIDGNGSAFERLTNPPAPPTGQSYAFDPQVEILQVNGLELEDLSIDGPGAPGDAGSGASESLYGLYANADQGLTLYQVDMQAIGGDFFDVVPLGIGSAEDDTTTPKGSDPPPDEVPYVGNNVDVTVTDCQWVGAGYHGVTIEDVEGAMFTGDEIDKAAVDAVVMDYEGVHSGPDYPEDDVTFEDDVFFSDADTVLAVTNSGNDPVDTLTFDDNELAGTTNATFLISGQSGTVPDTKTSLSVRNVDVSDNFQTRITEAGGAPYTEANDMRLSYVDGATVDDNQFNYNVGSSGQYQYPVQVDQTDQGIEVDDNEFVGSVAPVLALSGTRSSECGNIYSGEDPREASSGANENGQMDQGPCMVGAVPADGQVTVQWLAEYPGPGTEWADLGSSVPSAATPTYRVYVATASGAEDYEAAPACTTTTPAPVSATTTISCTVTGLVDGTTYDFTVEGSFGEGTPIPSAELSATPQVS